MTLVAGPVDEDRGDVLASGPDDHRSPLAGRRWLALLVAIVVGAAGLVYTGRGETTSDVPGGAPGAPADGLALPTPRGRLTTTDDTARTSDGRTGDAAVAATGVGDIVPDGVTSTLPTAIDWPARGSLRNLDAVRRLPDRVATAHPYHRAQLLLAESVGNGQLALMLLRLEDQSEPSRVVALWRSAEHPRERFREVAGVPFTGDQRSVSWARVDRGIADVVTVGPPSPGHAQIGVHRLSASGKVEREERTVGVVDGVAVTRVSAPSTRMLRLRIFNEGVLLRDGPPLLTDDASESGWRTVVPTQAVTDLPPRLRTLKLTATSGVADALGVPSGQLRVLASWAQRTTRPSGRRIDTVAMTLQTLGRRGTVQTVWEQRGGRKKFSSALVLARPIPAKGAERLPIAWRSRGDWVHVVVSRGSPRLVTLRKYPWPEVTAVVRNDRVASLHWPWPEDLSGAVVTLGTSGPTTEVGELADDDPLDIEPG